MTCILSTLAILLALRLAAWNGYAAVLFVPAGIAMALAAVHGRRANLWIAVGQIVLQLTGGVGQRIEGPWAQAVGLAGLLAIPLLQAQLGGWALRRWLGEPIRNWFNFTWKGNLLTESQLLAGAVWLAGAYLYLYSDLVVRRVGLYIYLAAFCVVLGVLSLLGLHLRQEWLIAILALVAVLRILAVGQAFLAAPGRRRRQ